MPDVFISYSRADQPFVRRLHAALDTLGLEAWVDWEDIPPTAEWMGEVRAAIEGSDTFIFVISPDSVRSPVCTREIGHATALGKRLVPIVYRPVDPEGVAESVRSRNWIFFRADDDFDAAAATLDTALHLDLEWAHEHTRLLVRAIDWDHNGRDESFVLRGRDLQEADRQLSQGPQHKTPTPTPLQTEYLGASHHAATRSTRLKIAALTTALIVAIVLGTVAFLQRQTAQHEATLARTQSLVSSATAALQTDPELSLLLAREAMNQSAGPEAEQVLRQALDDSYVRATIPGSGPAVSASYSPDGRQVIVAYQQGTAMVYDLRQPNKVAAVLKREKTVVTSAAFSPDGTHAVTGGDDGVASVWDLQHSSQPPLLLTGHTGAISSATFSPDGSRIVTTSTDGTARIWDAHLGGAALVVLTGHTGTVNDATFSPDGSRLLTAGTDGTARIWDTRNGGSALITLNVNGATASVTTASYSPDGTKIVTASSSNTGSPAPAQVWAATTGQLLFALPGEPANVNDAAFSPDGTQIVTASPDSTVRIWDVSQPTSAILTFYGHKGPVSSAVFNADGSQVLSAGQDGTVRIWTTRPNGEHDLLRIAGTEHTIFDAVISPNGRLVATASNDGLARIWSPQRPDEPPVVLQGHAGPVLGVAFSPDGTRIATAGADKTARIWNTTGVGAPLILTGHTGAVNAVEFSPDGRRIATASADGTVRVWDALSGTQLYSLPAGQGGGTFSLYDIAFSPDGQRIAVVGQSGIAEVLAATRQTNASLVNFMTSDENGAVNSVVFSPDGTRVITASDNGTAEVWDSRHATRSILTLTGHAGFVNDAEFSPDGKRIVTSGEDGTTRVWNAKTGEALSVFRGQVGTILSATFTPDGRHILTASDAGTADEWTCNLCVSTGRLLRLAQERSTRSLTPSERRRYLQSP